MTAGIVVKDRRKALLLLAGSRYEVYAPGPKAGQAFKHGKAAATRKDPCQLCDGDKVTRDRFGREQTCESCKGRGWHKVDPMIDSKAGSWEEQKLAASGTRRVLCDRCAGAGVWKQERCGMCDGAGKVSVPIVRPVISDADRETDVVLSEWDRMLELREKSGSFKEYDKCVAELARRSPHRHRVFHEVHVVKVASAGMLHPTQATLLEQAIRNLLAWMPVEILVPREIVQAERRVKQPAPKGRRAPENLIADRDAEMLERYRAGVKAAVIASDFDLHVSSVMRAIDRAEQAA